MENQTITSGKWISLGATDIKVSRLGIGAMTWGDLSISPGFNPARIAYGPAENKEELRKAVGTSLANNVTFLDTAAMYGKGASELIVGELTKDKDMIIATKFPSSFFPKTSDVTGDLDNSLTRLKRPYIGLYQIHYPSPWFSIPKVLIQMARAFHEGKIRAVGVSNFSEKQMRLAHKVLAGEGVRLASNQVEYSLLHREPEHNGVLYACRELNITLIAYMPLRMGALTGKYTGAVRPRGFRKFMSPFRKRDLPEIRRIVDLLTEIAKAYGKNPSQVALRWLIQKNNILPIPGAKNSKQALDNSGALTFSLSSSEMEALDRSARIDL